MGCTESTQVIQQKRKIHHQVQVVQKETVQEKQQKKQMIKQIPERGDCFLIGSISEKQQVFAHVKLQTMSINKMSIPIGGFTCNNFSSMLQIQKGKYFISGGINYDLTKISDSCYFYYSEDHKVEPLTPMQQARYTHSALYFPQKKAIYVIGGRFYGDDSQAILSNCQKYCLSQAKFTQLPPMNVKRCTCFVFTWNQTIYAFGGYTGPYQRSTLIEYLDQDQKSWNLLEVQLNRGLQGAILLPTDNNEITIFGGLTNSGPTDSVITINLQQKSIQSKRKLSQKRSLYKSFYKAGKVYFFGGDQDFTCQVYNILKQTSELTKKEFPFFIQDFDNLGFSISSVHVPYKQKIVSDKVQNQHDQIVYIIGTTQEPFLCELNISLPQAKFKNVPLNLKLHAHQGGVIIKPKQLILFGGIQDDSLSVISDDTYLYDMRKNDAKKLGKMSQNRYAFTYQTLKNDINEVEFIYCFGGATANTEGKLVFLNACEKFSIQQSKWQLISPLPQKLISPMSLVFKQQIFLFGGTNHNNKKSNSIYVYQPKLDTWCNLQSKLTFGIQAGSISRVSSNQFYIFGGLLQNGETEGIWSLYINQGLQNDKKQTVCVFQQKGKMNEKKAQHKIYKPRNQDFYVVFGGCKNPLTFYRSNLQQETSDSLINLKQMFINTLQYLNHKDLKGYLIVGQNQDY